MAEAVATGATLKEEETCSRPLGGAPRKTRADRRAEPRRGRAQRRAAVEAIRAEVGLGAQGGGRHGEDARRRGWLKELQTHLPPSFDEDEARKLGTVDDASIEACARGGRGRGRARRLNEERDDDRDGVVRGDLRRLRMATETTKDRLDAGPRASGPARRTSARPTR